MVGATAYTEEPGVTSPPLMSGHLPPGQLGLNPSTEEVVTRPLGPTRRD